MLLSWERKILNSGLFKMIHNNSIRLIVHRQLLFYFESNTPSERIDTLLCNLAERGRIHEIINLLGGRKFAKILSPASYVVQNPLYQYPKETCRIHIPKNTTTLVFCAPSTIEKEDPVYEVLQPETSVHVNALP